jgi:hypothetical protein
MKRKIKEKNIAKKVAGMEDIVAYDAMNNKSIVLDKVKNSTADSNIINFSHASDKKREFHVYRRYDADNYNKVLFVSKALSKDKKEIRAALFKSLIHIDIEENKKIIIATDGQRMHMAQINVDLLPGDYNVRFDKDCIALIGPMEIVDFVYPTWRKILPSDVVKKVDINFRNTGLSKRKISELTHMSMRMYSLIKETNKIINLCYLDDLTKDNIWSVCINEDMKNSPVLFKHSINQDMIALIMPIDPE